MLAFSTKYSVADCKEYLLCYREERLMAVTANRNGAWAIFPLVYSRNTLCSSRAWTFTPVIPANRELRQNDSLELEATLATE